MNPSIEFDNVRVRVCLESNDLLCGPYNEASVVDKIQVRIVLDPLLNNEMTLFVSGTSDLQ